METKTESKTLFETLSQIDVNSKVEEKQKQKYLSWVYAWSEFKKSCPDATYKVIEQQDGTPFFPSNIGIMVKTEVTANNETHSMWLPVMDSSNKAMKQERYSYKVKEYSGTYPNRKETGNYIDKWVDAATMFDVNTAIMRCLVKNIAMFGLGLYIYAGEDMPDIPTINAEQINEITKFATEHNINLSALTSAYGITKVTALYVTSFDGAMQWLKDYAAANPK